MRHAMRYLLIIILLTVHLPRVQSAPDDAEYRGEPRTIAHEFLDLEKNFGVTTSQYAAVDSLLNKALTRVTYKKGGSTEDAVRTLIEIDGLLKEEGYVFKANYLLSRGLENKTIDCDNYCALYIAIAEVMSIPIVPVYAPNHSFLRIYFDDGSYLNWEPTESRPQPDSYYVNTLLIAEQSIKKGVYLKTLTRKEFFAVEYNNIGAQLMTKGRYDEAIPYFSTAAQFYPAFSSAYHNRGTCLYAERRGKEALADLQKAAELDPMRATTRNTLGDIYFDYKEYNKALGEYSTSIRLDPTNYAPYTGISMIMKILGKEKEAEKWHKKSQEIKAKYPLR